MGRAYEVRKASILKTGAVKAKLYSMYAREIYQAAKTGGTDPDSNLALRKLVEKAKKELEWEADLTLNDMVQDAWKWQLNLE